MPSIVSFLSSSCYFHIILVWPMNIKSVQYFVYLIFFLFCSLQSKLSFAVDRAKKNISIPFLFDIHIYIDKTNRYTLDMDNLFVGVVSSLLRHSFCNFLFVSFSKLQNKSRSVPLLHSRRSEPTTSDRVHAPSQ